MRLTDLEIAARIEKPANQSHVKAGTNEEKRHRMHVNGDTRILEKFLSKIDLLETEDTYKLRTRFTKKYTKSIYAQIKNLFFKAFTTHGNVIKYSFSRDNLEDDFQEYLDSNWNDGFFSSIHEQIKQICFTGFQGVFLVDLPTNDEGDSLPRLPEPFYQYIPSESIFDIEISGNEILFLLLKAERTEIINDRVERVVQYFAIDDQRFVQFEKRQGDAVKIGESFHEIGYVPACPVTKLAAADDNDIQRDSLISPSIEIADMLLTDHSEHELNKRLHAFQEKWSYAVECDDCSATGKTTFHDGDSLHEIACKTCSGKGSYIPAGPDKVYRVNTPNDKDDPSVQLPPAGYVDKDLSPTEYLFKQINEEEDRIPKSIFSREGIVSFNTKVETAHGKEIDMQSVYDKIKEFSEHTEFVVKFILETMARYRYGDTFVSCHISYNKNYGLRNASQLEAEYAEKKKAGFDEGLLLPHLEQIIKSRYRNNPSELKRQMIILKLTPFPTMTLMEVKDLPFVSAEQKRMKAYLNNYITRFEQDNGSIAVFGRLLPMSERLSRIQEIINQYNLENDATDEENQSQLQRPGGQRSGVVA